MSGKNVPDFLRGPVEASEEVLDEGLGEADTTFGLDADDLTFQRDRAFALTIAAYLEGQKNPKVPFRFSLTAGQLRTLRGELSKVEEAAEWVEDT